MSFTAVYTEFRAYDPETGEATEYPPKILDREGLHEAGERVPNMSESTYRGMMITDEKTVYGYPKETWDVLKGFKTWKPKDVLGHYDSIRQAYEDLEDSTGSLGFNYNIERCGIPYGGLEGVWKSLFSVVSEYTEPFQCFHSPWEHKFPSTTDFKDGTESVYFVRCDDGAVYVEERTFELTDTEVLLDETKQETEADT